MNKFWNWLCGDAGNLWRHVLWIPRITIILCMIVLLPYANVINYMWTRGECARGNWEWDKGVSWGYLSFKIQAVIAVIVILLCFIF